jgi:hypothetical protein
MGKKYIITENRLNNIANTWLNDRYGDLRKRKFQGYPNDEFLSTDEGMFFMNYHKNTKIIEVKHKISDELENMFGFDQQMSREILIPWVENKYGYKIKRMVFHTEV